MHEVLTVSFAQRANHLSTHLFNSQDGYLDRTAGASKSSVDPEVFFRPRFSPDGKSVSYTPRALLWDVRDGFGAMGQFEYVDESGDVEGVEKVETGQRIPKNAYQRGLDGMAQELPKLSTRDTRYFSDFARVLYEPLSFHMLQRWTLDRKDFGRSVSVTSEAVPFDRHETGVAEWETSGTEFMDESFRKSLESCDLLNGINLIAEIDSAWGGFSTKFLADLRDEYLPKTTCFVWGLYENTDCFQMTRVRGLSRIQTTLDFLRDESSIFVPISTSPKYPNIDSSSLWHMSAVQSVVLDSWATLLSQRENRVSMSDFEMGLTMGTHRRIVSETSFRFSDGAKHVINPNFMVTGSHVFSQSVINRCCSEVAQNKLLGNGFVEYRSGLKYTQPSSFPCEEICIPDDGEVLCDLNISDGAKGFLSEMSRYAKKRMPASLSEEYVEELGTMKQEYQFGYEDDSDDYE